MSEPNVVEIDAIAVEEWDSEQHTPVHAESNLAELVKQSGLDGGWETSTKEEPSQAAAIEKPRTTTNTMRRTGAAPAMPSKVHKTMALPTVAAVRPAPAVVAKGTETKSAVAKPAAKSPTKTTATGVTPVAAPAKPAAKSAAPAPKTATKTTATGVTPVVAAAAPAAATPPAAAKAAKPVSTKTTATGVAPVVPAAPTFSPFGNEPAAAKAAPAPANPARTDATPPPMKPARADATPSPATVQAAKPARTDATPPPKPARADATPPPATVQAAKPARTDATPPPKPARADATPPPATVQAAKPARTDATPAKPVRADATPAKPARVPEVLTKPAGEAIAARLAAVAAPARAPSALELPAWPPAPAGAAKDFEDWDELGGATSVGTQEREQPPRAPGEVSVIVDLNAQPKAEVAKAARPPTFPITSEQGTATSGAFVMPTPSTERPTSPALAIPVVLAAAPAAVSAPASEASHAASAWHTPLPLAAPPPEPAPQWPSAAGLDYARAQGSAPEIPVPARHEPTEPRIARSSLLATVFPTPKSRKRGLLGAAGAVVAILVVVLATSGGSAKPDPDRTAATSTRATPTEASATRSSATASSTSSPAAAPTSAKATAAARVVAATDPAAASPTAATEPAKKKPIVAKRRISRGKKPVVVDYDKKPDPTPEQDEALTRARADYATGNRHLFAGEAAAAIISYRQALAAYPNYVAGYRGLGLAFAQQGDKAAALDAFKTYVKLAPTAKDVALIKKRIASLSVR